MDFSSLKSRYLIASILILIAMLFIFSITSVNILSNSDAWNNPGKVSALMDGGHILPEISLNPTKVASNILLGQEHYNNNNDVTNNVGIMGVGQNESAITQSMATPTTAPLIPSLLLDETYIVVYRGDIATNSGHVETSDLSNIQLEPSVGTIQTMPDNSWTWHYQTDDTTIDNQTVVINVFQSGQYLTRRSFTMIIEESNDTSSAEVLPPETRLLRLDSNFIEVEQGKLAVNTGSILGKDVTSMEASIGGIDLLPDGSWIWVYPTDPGVLSPQNYTIQVNVQFADGEVLESSFALNTTVNTVIINQTFNQEVIINEAPPVQPTTNIGNQIPTTEPTSGVVIIATDAGVSNSTNNPTDVPTLVPTSTPTDVPTLMPTNTPTEEQAEVAVIIPTNIPTNTPTDVPTLVPTNTPTNIPTDVPTLVPTNTPTKVPTLVPTNIPTDIPTLVPTNTPTNTPLPTLVPTNTPTLIPTKVPTLVPTLVPTNTPTNTPLPTLVPTNTPTLIPTKVPTLVPTNTPTKVPTLVPTNTPTDVPTTPVDGAYYVSRNGNNGDGKSWASAWNELNQIKWSVLKPGDVIYLDGGSTQMVYKTEMQIGKSGTANNPIRIQVSQERGHNGQVVFFGGREVGLPYCGQNSFDTSKEDSLKEYGIRTNNYDYIVIDGMDWRGIVIHGYRRNGIRLDTNSTNITIRHMEIYNNGRPTYWKGELGSDEPGIRLGGANITVQRTLIHDNGQDAMQGAWKPTDAPLNLLVEQSWFYNERRHPTVNESFNWCAHSDAIHIFTGGITSGITIKESILGPGFTNTLIWGDQWADIVDVLIEDTLIIKGADNNITGHSSITDMHNWTLNRVTLHCPNTKYTCLYMHNSDHSITNSVIVGSYLRFRDGLDHYENNCIWQTKEFKLGTVEDPKFVNVQDDPFSIGDYTVQNPNCIGSRLTSPDQLFSGQIGSIAARTVQSSPQSAAFAQQVEVIQPTMTPTLAPPIISVDQTQISGTEAQTVINTGLAYSEYASIESISASIGTVSLGQDNVWVWSYAAADGTSTDQTIMVEAVDSNGMTSQVHFTMNVANVPPTATLMTTDINVTNVSFVLTFSDAVDVSDEDNLAGFTYQYDCDGDGLFELTDAASTAVCNVETLEQITPIGRIIDKDGGIADYPSDLASQLAQQTLEIVQIEEPTTVPTEVEPTVAPTEQPVIESTATPTLVPTTTPTMVPTDIPTLVPTATPTLIPTNIPTLVPTAIPTDIPTLVPTVEPSASAQDVTMTEPDTTSVDLTDVTDAGTTDGTD